MTNTFVAVPNGMSYVNAAYTLWKQAKSKNFSTPVTVFKTAETVVEWFKNAQPLFFLDDIDGKDIKVSFKYFPLLEVSIYDSMYGEGAAQRALDVYDLVAKEERLDKKNSHRFTTLKIQ